MTRADQAVDDAAGKLEDTVSSAESSGGLKAKIAEPFAGDPAFLRKLKPSRVKARSKGTPTKSGRSPWVAVGVAFAVGYGLAKVIDWRGHAHPHR